MRPDPREFARNDLGMCKTIHAESVGRPGSRYFRLHADADRGTVLLWLEKEHLYELAMAIKRLMEKELAEPISGQASPAGDVSVDHEFKAFRMALAHDDESGIYLLLANAEEEEEEEEGEESDDTPDLALRVRADQLDRLADEALAVCASGRPRCPLCGAAMNEGETHVCPRSNGHVHIEV